MGEKFFAEIKKVEGINGAYIEIPFDVEKVFGKKRVKVKAFFDGCEYRGSIVSMGGCYIIGITQGIRRKIGKEPGDLVEVEIEKDEEERVVELPDDFKVALEKNLNAKEVFKGLSYTHKKEYIKWIIEAKKEETRKNRIEKAINMLIEGKKIK